MAWNFPKSLSDWIAQKYKCDAWLVKFSSKCILALHEIWAECCTICHESTTEMIRAEDHETLQINVANALKTHPDLPPTLKRYRESAQSMSSSHLRAFLREFYSFTQDATTSQDLSNFTLHSSTHYCRDISPAAQELRYKVTCKRHQQLFSRQCDKLGLLSPRLPLVRLSRAFGAPLSDINLSSCSNKTMLYAFLTRRVLLH